MNPVVRLGGRLRLDDGVNALREAVREALRQEQAEMVLDLRQVTDIDSSGLAELLSSRAAMEARGQRLRLTRVSKPVRNVLRITRLDKVFEIVRAQRAAVLEFRRLAA